MIPDRLKALYAALPPGLRRGAPPWLEDLGARAARRFFGPASTLPVRRLEAKLRAGHAGPAAADLAALIANPRAHPRRAAEAAWTLALARAGTGEPEAALAALERMRALRPRWRRREDRLVAADCLIRAGRPAEARARLDPLLGPLPGDPEAALLAAAAEPDATARLALVAAAFGPVGGIAADPDRPPSLDALQGPLPGLLSVVVPVHLHWSLAERLLAALAAQSLPADRFEAILVNNGGPLPDPPPTAPGALRLRLLDCPAPGAYAARNHGAARAAGALLVFTDADCAPDPGWLEAFAEAAAAGPPRLLAGPIRMEAARREAALNPYAAYDRLRGIPQERYLRRGYAATANLAIPRAVFARLGGFDATRFSGGDAEFCRRAGRAGVPIALVAAAGVGHPVRDSWAALETKARRVKGGQIRGGALPSRALWLARTLTPPLRALVRFLRLPAPWPERRAAIGVLFRLWGVELAETARLLAGRTPERR